METKTKINWYPGHMVKAQKEIVEKLKLVDVCFELLDARIPMSSQNPSVSSLVKNKPRIILLNKASLADPIKTNEWVNFFQKKGIKAIPIDALNGINMKEIMIETKKVLAKKFEEDKKKGFRISTVRAMIIGIPNVGKSTLINKLVSKNIAKTGDKPGVTKAQQWIKVNDELELLDTPGNLWPKFDNDDISYRLAVTGAIKDDILPLDEVCIYLFEFLDKKYKDNLLKRYGEMDYDINTIVTLFDAIGKKRGCITNGEIDYDKVSRLVLQDFRNQRLGRVTLDGCEEY